MRFLAFGRSMAVVISVITLVTLLLNGSFERPGESAFLIPDLLLSAALLIGAALPATGARTVLTFAFGLSAGVFTSAFFSHLVEEEGAAAWRVSGVLILALGSTAMTLLLTRPAGHTHVARFASLRGPTRSGVSGG